MELEITMRNANIPVLVARCERIPMRMGVDRLRKLCAPVREKCPVILTLCPQESQVIFHLMDYKGMLRMRMHFIDTKTRTKYFCVIGCNHKG